MSLKEGRSLCGPPLHFHKQSCEQPTKWFFVSLVHNVLSKMLLIDLQGPAARTASQKFKQCQVLRRHLLIYDMPPRHMDSNGFGSGNAVVVTVKRWCKHQLAPIGVDQSTCAAHTRPCLTRSNRETGSMASQCAVVMQQHPSSPHACFGSTLILEVCNCWHLPTGHVTTNRRLLNTPIRVCMP